MARPGKPDDLPSFDDVLGWIYLFTAVLTLFRAVNPHR